MLQLTRPLSLLGGQLRTIKTVLLEFEALLTLLAQESDIVQATDAIDLPTIETIQFNETRGILHP